ncbi:hypothetical protein D3C77_350390 [compost metagenome]
MRGARFGGAGGAVGLLRAGFGYRDGVGRRLLALLGLGQGIHQGVALLGEAGGRGLGLRQGGLRLLRIALQRLEAAGAVGRARDPALAGVGQAAQPLFAHGAVAGLLVAGRTGRLRRQAGAFGPAARLGQLLTQADHHVGGRLHRAGFGEGGLGLLHLAVQPGDGLVQRLGAGFLAGLIAHQGFQPIARRDDLLVQREGAQARGLHLFLGGAEGFARRLQRALRRLQRGLACVDLGFQFRQAGALGQTHGGGTRRLGAADEAVPAIEVALDRRQARPARQGAGQFGDPFARGHAAEGQSRRQLIRRRHMGGQGLDALRPVGRGGVGARPVRGRAGVQRGVQIIAQRRRQRGLIALGGRHLV